MPGYGLLPADQGTGLLSWSWAERKLRESHDYWVASRWPDGRPHLTPVWGVWDDGLFWFSSAGRSRKVHNLLADARCSVAVDDALDPVIVEGIAEIRADVDDRRRYLDAMNAKYQVAYGLDFLDGVRNLCLRVRPVSAIGLLQDDFSGSPTRWSFTAE